MVLGGKYELIHITSYYLLVRITNKLLKEDIQFMTEVKTSLAAKLSVAFVAAAMIFTMFAPGAQAQSSEEMQQMINDLLAQVSELQAQLGQDGGATAGPAGVCPYTWTRNLGQGDRGEDVMRLQQLLNSDPDTRVAASGPGSAGNETEYYGALTAAAVSKMQTAYRSEVLTPLGLQNPTGYFGNSSRAKANELCAEAPAPAPEPEDEDEVEDEDEMEDEDEDDARAPLSGGEALLDRFDLRSGEFSVAREGQSDVPVAELELEVADGDASVNRLDLEFNSNNGVEERPWENFRSVSIWMDGEKLAEVDTDRRGDWTRGTSGGNWDRVRMTGLDVILREDVRSEIVIAVTPRSTVRGLATEASYEWEVRVPDRGFRMRDAVGIDTFNDGATPAQTFDIEEAGADDELRVRSSNNDPSATTIEVEDDRRSSFFDIFAFDLDTRDSMNEIEIFEIPVDITVSDYDDVTFDEDIHADIFNDLRLVIDGRTYRDFEWEMDGDNASTTEGADGAATRKATFTFDDELFVGAGDRVTVELQARFNQQSGTSGYDNGTKVQSRVEGDSVRAEGSNMLTDSQKGGSATSEQHTLRTEGVLAELVSSSQTSRSDDTVGEYTMTVDVTAIGDDMTIEESAIEDAFTGAEKSFAYMVSGPGAATSSASASVSRVSGGTRVTSSDPDAYRISEGSTATFEIIVTVSSVEDSGQYRVTLTDIGFTSATGDYFTEALTPPSDFRTSNMFIDIN